MNLDRKGEKGRNVRERGKERSRGREMNRDRKDQGKWRMEEKKDTSNIGGL